MGKEIFKNAGAAATQSVLLDLMPMMKEHFAMLQAGITAMQSDIRSLEAKLDHVDRRLDAKIDTLRENMLEKFSQHLETTHEISHRITKLDGRIEGFMELFGKMFEPVKMPQRRRKAS